MIEAVRATADREQRLGMPFSLRLSRLLYFPFTTLWAVAYYIVYFRNPIYFGLIAIAVAFDAVRLSPQSSSRLYAVINTYWRAIISVIATLFILQCWLVVSGTFPQVAFGLPYNHYRTALEVVSKFHAAIIYCVEAVGALAAFLVIAYYSLQMATLQATSFLERTNRYLSKVNPRAAMRRLVWFFVLIYATQFFASIITIDIHGRPGPYDYHPEWNPFDLAMFAASPIFFANGMKYWLRTVVAYVSQAKSRSPGARL